MNIPNLDRCRQALEAHLPGEEIVEAIPLAGQASLRRYFRLRGKSGRSFVLMQLPNGIASSVSEEISAQGLVAKELPFVAVTRYLERIGVPVPKLYFYLEGEGQILLEDLGDQSLEFLLRKGGEAFYLFYYKQAIALLLDWQEKTLRAPDAANIAFQRKFDFSLLYWECEHFLQYGVEDYFKIKIAPELRAPLEADFRRLCEEIMTLPTLLVHRDFQSRNLHLAGYELKCIDFQDALIGPFIYDLVSLLRDSYVVLSQDCVAALLDFYWQEAQMRGLSLGWGLDKAHFTRAFHLQTLQRKLKDTGRFQYIYTEKKNSDFLPYRVPSLGYVREAFAALPDYQGLKRRLEKWM